jgi:hypothetical protein
MQKLKKYRGFIIGLAMGVVVLPVSVGAVQKVFDPTAELNGGDVFNLQRFDDPDFQVKCWTSSQWSEAGISCLPWSQVKER